MDMFTFQKKYFYWTLTLFWIEVGIAVFIKDRFVRPLVGDVLVVILIYCFAKTFLKVKSAIIAVSVLVFACAIEILQYFNIVNILGLQNNKILAVALGSTFDWHDILAYAIGTVSILWLEKRGN